MLKYLLVILMLFVFSCAKDNNNYYPQGYAPQPYQQQYYPQQYYRPNSRAYSNPYTLPQQYASPYYDTDQYYVPPTNYYNIEKPDVSPTNNKY